MSFSKIIIPFKRNQALGPDPEKAEESSSSKRQKFIVPYQLPTAPEHTNWVRWSSKFELHCKPIYFLDASLPRPSWVPQGAKNLYLNAGRAGIQTGVVMIRQTGAFEFSKTLVLHAETAKGDIKMQLHDSFAPTTSTSVRPFIDFVVNINVKGDAKIQIPRSFRGKIELQILQGYAHLSPAIYESLSSDDINNSPHPYGGSTKKFHIGAKQSEEQVDSVMICVAKGNATVQYDEETVRKWNCVIAYPENLDYTFI